MEIKFKSLGLILGLTSVIISFFFFGRQIGVYQILLISGLLISFICYLIIIFSKTPIKSKLTWTIVILLAIAVQYFSEPLLIKYSYWTYLYSNKKELTEVNGILKDKKSEIVILNDAVRVKDGVLSENEKQELLKLRKKLDVYYISKSEAGVYFGLWGFLDVRHGLTYWTSSEIPNSTYQHLTQNWYY